MTAPTGYSKKSLAEKLGIKTHMRIAILNAPEDYLSRTLLELPPDVEIIQTLDGQFDLIHFFAPNTEALTVNFDYLKQHLTQKGSLWISWIKLSSGIPTDLGENAVRQIGLNGGLVDVKVISVNTIWSALKFVYRLGDRTG